MEVADLSVVAVVEVERRPHEPTILQLDSETRVSSEVEGEVALDFLTPPAEAPIVEKLLSPTHYYVRRLGGGVSVENPDAAMFIGRSLLLPADKRRLRESCPKELKGHVMSCLLEVVNCVGAMADYEKDLIMQATLDRQQSVNFCQLLEEEKEKVKAGDAKIQELATQVEALSKQVEALALDKGVL